MTIIKLDNIKLSRPDAGDAAYQYAKTSPYPEPNAVSWYTPEQDIEDQRAVGNCTAQATIGMSESVARYNGVHADLSPQFLYFNTLDYENRLGQDGAQMRNALKMAQKFGLANKSLWDANDDHVFDRPSQETYLQAMTQRIGAYRTMPIGGGDKWEENYKRIRSSIAEGYRPIFVITIYNWMFYLKAPLSSHNLIPQCPPDVDKFKFAGLHAVFSDSYDNSLLGTGAFVAQSSWGNEYGDNGRIALSYGNVIHNILEAWAVEPFLGLGQKYSVNQMRVAQLYAALFGRAPEKSGMDYWVSQLDANATSSTMLAAQMYGAPQARVMYPESTTNADFLYRFYSNILGRLPDADGLRYWLAVCDNHTRAEVIVALLDAVAGYSGTDPAGVMSRKFFENKCAVGLYCAAALGCDSIPICEGAFAGVTDDPQTVEPARGALRAAMLVMP